MATELDTADVAQTGVADGSSISVSVDSDRSAETVAAFVDDTNGGDPATYDITFETSTPGGIDMEQDSTTGTTARFHSVEAVPESVTVTVTNQSGASADFRLVVVSKE